MHPYSSPRPRSTARPPAAVSDSDDLRPIWCLSRGNGTFVPLIAVDELPDHIRVIQAPRSLSLTQTVGMQYIGEVRPSGLTYNVEIMPRQQQPPHPAELIRGRSVDYNAPTVGTEYDDEQPGSESSLSADVIRHPGPERGEARPFNVPLIKHTDIKRNDIKRTDIKRTDIKRTDDSQTTGPTRRPPPPSGREPDLSKKKFCTHWIRTGECDYMQQGCIYKHVMPDAPTLRKIGFRSVPIWWKEHQAAQRRQDALKTAGTPSRASGDSASASTQSTDTGSLHLGNPDSQRFRKTGLPKRHEGQKQDANTAPASTSAPTPAPRAVPAAPHRKPAERARSTNRGAVSAEHDELDLLNLRSPALIPSKTPTKSSSASAARVERDYAAATAQRVPDSPSAVHKPLFTARPARTAAAPVVAAEVARPGESRAETSTAPRRGPVWPKHSPKKQGSRRARAQAQRATDFFNTETEVSSSE